MPPNNNKITKAYHFFVDAEKNGKAFSLLDIANASGWSLGTTRTYRGKKWHFFLKELPEGLICDGILNVSLDAFIRIHGQKTDISSEILRPRFTPNVDALIDKARESALLAVQVYNNPLTTFRTPGFIVHMVIGFTAFFHAVFERNGTEYWYKNADGTAKEIDGDKYAWDVSECIKHYFGARVSPVAENLKFFVNIRNKIEHRFVPALDITFSGKCQSLLMNFEELLINEFGGYFVLGQSLALALQFSSYSAEQQKALRKIQSHEYEVIRKYTDAYDAALPEEVTQSMEYSFRAFLIPKIGNHAKTSDVAIEFVKYDPNNPDQMAQYDKQVAFIKEKLVPAANVNRMLPKDVIKRVQQVTGLSFTQTHHTNAWKMFKVRPSGQKADGCNVKYCQFDVAFRQYVYTEDWIELLVTTIAIPEKFEQIKNYRPE